MLDPLALVAGAGGAALVALWAAHVRRDVTRRRGRSAEFDGSDGAGALWTSAARCPECRASGALLSREGGPDGEQLWHSCMACGHRHRREHRG